MFTYGTAEVTDTWYPAVPVCDLTSRRGTTHTTIPSSYFCLRLPAPLAHNPHHAARQTPKPFKRERARASGQLSEKVITYLCFAGGETCNHWTASGEHATWFSGRWSAGRIRDQAGQKISVECLLDGLKVVSSHQGIQRKPSVAVRRKLRRYGARQLTKGARGTGGPSGWRTVSW